MDDLSSRVELAFSEGCRVADTTRAVCSGGLVLRGCVRPSVCYLLDIVKEGAGNDYVQYPTNVEVTTPEGERKTVWHPHYDETQHSDPVITRVVWVPRG
jgi:hypothetical protein